MQCTYKIGTITTTTMIPPNDIVIFLLKVTSIVCIFNFRFSKIILRCRTLYVSTKLESKKFMWRFFQSGEIELRKRVLKIPPAMP